MKNLIGTGYTSYCYLIDNNEVVKIYKNEHLSKYTNPKLFNIKNDTYVFYKEGFYLDNSLVAVLMDYAEGKKLEAQDSNFSLDLFINAIDKVYKDTDLLSDRYILTNDVNPQNILFSDKFKIIDVDFYNYDFKNNYIYECNINNFNLGIYDYLFKKKMVKSFKFILKDKKLKDLFNQTFKLNIDNKTLKEFLILLKKMLEEDLDEEIKTTLDLQKSIEKVRKIR